MHAFDGTPNYTEKCRPRWESGQVEQTTFAPFRGHSVAKFNLSSFRRTAKSTVMHASAAAKRQAFTIILRVTALLVDFAVLLCHFYDGKQLPNATSSFGDPLKRILRRTKAQNKLRSFAKNPSHVALSAVSRKSAFPS